MSVVEVWVDQSPSKWKILMPLLVRIERPGKHKKKIRYKKHNKGHLYLLFDLLLAQTFPVKKDLAMDHQQLQK